MLTAKVVCYSVSLLPLQKNLSKMEVGKLKIRTLIFAVLLAAFLAFFKIYTMKLSLEKYKPKIHVDPEQLYEENLKKFDKKKKKCVNASSFQVWKAMPKIVEIPLALKHSALTSRDSPPGVMGRPVFLHKNLKNPLEQSIVKGWKDHEFNEFVSDLIPINRTLPDVRDDWCTKQTYAHNLPQTSVVIVFHNEAWSTLLRTIHSVILHSPKHLLKEIILVDDHSFYGHLHDRLDSYLENFPKVTLIRLPQREGLIRGRILAMSHVTAPIVVFLDSHCECTPGWLEPLLDRIVQDETKVVSPIVDLIHDDTFEYVDEDIHNLRIGGFDWGLKFKWLPIPNSQLRKRKYPASPIKTPTISGGLFAINKKFFEKLGYYDDGFNYWGAENLELSFKTWMCGGSLEIIPCSHVGHVFRSRFPYHMEPGSARRNCIRLAKVWMDDYAKYFYETIAYDIKDYGDVSQREQLRKQLNCKSFEWYLSNIYSELKIPNNSVASGAISDLTGGGETLCFDALADPISYTAGVNVRYCQNKGGTQHWVYTNEGQLMRDSLCLEDSDLGDYILRLDPCTSITKNQVWIYNNKTKLIKNMQTKECITSVHVGSGHLDWKLMMQPCNKNKHRQQWAMQNFKVERLLPDLRKLAEGNYV